MIVFPLRTSLTQRGGAESDPATFNDVPPVVGLHCIATPFEDETSISACAELALRVSRIITPALDQRSAAETLLTRACIVTSPVIC